MKRISLITLHTPTIENINGASALPYHLISSRPKDIDVLVYSFNVNRISTIQIEVIEKKLGVKISILPLNLGYRLLSTKYLSWTRMFMRFPLLHGLKLSKAIKEKIIESSNYVWIYGEDISHFAKLFSIKVKCVVTTPDCEALYYSRVISMPSKAKDFFSIARYAKAYSQYINLARSLPTENVCYHLVGLADTDFLRLLKPNINATFIPHPHYDGNIHRHIQFHKPKIKLLISGRYDFYCKDNVDKAIRTISMSHKLSHQYTITFQGKGWDGCAELLTSKGFDVHMVGYVESYKEELCKHDILLSSVTVGTGTKGKVLDAFINGLLVIGTPYSIENINVADKRDFFFYNDGDGLVDILSYIPHHIKECEQIAYNGRDAVVKHHSIEDISTKFYRIFNI